MYERETCRHAFALQLAGIHGIRSDKQTTEELETVLTVEANILKAKMREKGIFRDDGTRDTKRLKALVEEAFAKIQLPVPKTEPSKSYPNGQTSTSADTLMLSGDPTLTALGDGQGPLKLLSTFVPALKAATEIPLQIGYEVLVITGRTSAKNPIKRKKGEIPVGINIQQIPKDRRDDAGNILLGTRNCLVPRVGKIFCSTDYSVAELGALAEVQFRLFGKSALRDVLLKGVDPHLMMAATILDKPLEWVVENKKTREVKDARTFAKICNFGLPGGLGAPALVDYARTNYGVKLTLEFAVNLVRLYFKTWPEQRQLFAHVKDKVGETQGEIVQLIGTPLRHGARRFTQASNLLFQGPVAQIAKEALWRVQWEMYLGDDGWKLDDVWQNRRAAEMDAVQVSYGEYDVLQNIQASPLFGCRTVAFIHDEILSELPNDPVLRTNAANRQAEVMRMTMAEYLPNIPAVCEPALCEVWDKDMETVLDDNGILHPWVRPVEEKKAT
jgi:DNA polymerase I-like protein with 3'-5' exonuclease and polymerase domains